MKKNYVLKFSWWKYGKTDCYDIVMVLLLYFMLLFI